MSTYSDPWYNVYKDSESSDGQSRHDPINIQRVLMAESKPAIFIKPVKTPRRKRRTKVQIVQDTISNEICSLFA